MREGGPPPPRGGGRMAAALAIFEPYLPGCIPDQAGLLWGTDPSIAYIPYIQDVLLFCGVRERVTAVHKLLN